MSTTTRSQVELDRQRRYAVQSRLDGHTVAEASRQSGLSAPTVIAAHKAYLRGGWEAVRVKPRGRPTGDSQIPEAQQMELRTQLLGKQPENFEPDTTLWTCAMANRWLKQQGHTMTDRSASSYFDRWHLSATYPLDTLKAASKNGENDELQRWLRDDYPCLLETAKKNGTRIYWVSVTPLTDCTLYRAHNLRKKFLWLTYPTGRDSRASDAICIDFFNRLQSEANGKVLIFLKGIDIARIESIQQWLSEHRDVFEVILPPGPGGTNEQAQTSNTTRNQPISTRNNKQKQSANRHLPTTEHTMTVVADSSDTASDPKHPTHSAGQESPTTLTHLQRLEAESIHIMREVIAEADKPVMLYSIGKDSAVLLHLALKAFYPAKPPFPLLHVDTTWKFRAMYDFRDQIVQEYGLELLSYTNPDGLAQKVNPFTHGSALHTDIMKTQALRQALDKHQFDVAIGGARRDEEMSRAKERIFSFRSAQHRWEPKQQRPELWRLYNACKQKGESIRVFPLSNWTELDIWQYIYKESIPIVPLYLAAERPVVERDGKLIMVDDERMPLQSGEVPMLRSIRFRTLGCYPLTGAVESTATTVPDIIQETLLARTSERQGRMIDHDTAASMEKKKQEGYF